MIRQGRRKPLCSFRLLRKWLNEKYKERVDYGAEGRPLFPRYSRSPDSEDEVEVDENLTDTASE